MSAVAVAGARIFDGEAMRGPGVVRVANGRIVEISDVSRSAVDDVTVLPGFIDAHVHLGFFSPHVVARGGVTAARDLGWPLDASIVAADGPFVLRAGPIITARGGYPSRAAWAPPGTAREVDDEPAARAAVRGVAAAGACIVKIAQEPRAGAVLPASVVRAIVEEARAHGLRVTSHCGSLAQLEIALDAGVAELAHGLWSDEPIPGETVTRMVRAGMTVIPTLHVDPHPTRIANLRAFARAGGRVVYGTDMGNPPAPGGINPVEIALMRQAGISARDAVRAATGDAAAYLGLAGRGRVVPGARADLVVVPGDPLEDPEVLARPRAVFMAGEQIA